MATPYSVTVLEEVASTQDLARSEAEAGTPAVVVAGRQTSGRGRSGAEWETAPRAVAVSVAFRPARPSQRWALIPLMAGVAARRCLGEHVALKWPNDLLVGEAKVGGILVEASGGLMVAGLGLNLYWPHPPDGAGALHEADPGAGAGPELAQAWAAELVDLVDGEPWPREEYEGACTTLGRDITWEPGGRGRAIGIGDDGSLHVVDDTGTERTLSAGAVRHVRGKWPHVK